MYTEFEEGLVDTNTWGWVGSGILVYRAPGDIFLGMRSMHVTPPSLYGLPGGQVPLAKRNNLRDIRLSAVQEFYEEVGVKLDDSLYLDRFFVYPDSDLFIAIDESEDILSAYNAQGEYAQYFVFLYQAPDRLANVSNNTTISAPNWENDYFLWLNLDSIPYDECVDGLEAEITGLVD